MLDIVPVGVLLVAGVVLLVPNIYELRLLRIPPLEVDEVSGDAGDDSDDEAADVEADWVDEEELESASVAEELLSVDVDMDMASSEVEGSGVGSFLTIFGDVEVVAEDVSNGLQPSWILSMESKVPLYSQLVLKSV